MTEETAIRIAEAVERAGDSIVIVGLSVFIAICGAIVVWVFNR